MRMEKVPSSGVFAKLRKETIDLTSLPVRSSVRTCGSHWMDFREILYLKIFRKSVEKIRVALNLTTITGTIYEYLCTFMVIAH
jgi:hypothetical protein